MYALWVRMNEAEARRSIADQIAEANLQIQQAVGNMTELDAEMARLAKSMPWANPGDLAKLKAWKEAASLADFAKGETEALKGPEQRLREYAERIKEAVQAGYMTAAQGEAAVRSKAEEISPKAQSRKSVETAGTFNASALAGLAAGGVEDRIADATRETARNTARLLDEAQRGGIVFN